MLAGRFQCQTEALRSTETAGEGLNYKPSWIQEYICRRERNGRGDYSDVSVVISMVSAIMIHTSEALEVRGSGSSDNCGDGNG